MTDSDGNISIWISPRITNILRSLNSGYPAEMNFEKEYERYPFYALHVFYEKCE